MDSLGSDTFINARSCGCGGVGDATLPVLIAALAAATFFLYNAIIMAGRKRRRRRRELKDTSYSLTDLFFQGNHKI